MTSYITLPDEELTKENLIKHKEFMQHIRTFLRKRNNKVYATRDETFEAYLDHMRTGAVGDVTPLFDYQYASQADVIIYFVDYSSSSGWNKKEKMHLFY